MLKHKLCTTLLTAICCFVFHTNVYTNSSKPPLARTGAPDESTTCGASGCHNVSPNAGDGTLTINYGQEDNVYSPETNYDMSVSITNTDATRFGFEMVALDGDGNSAGSFVTIGSDDLVSVSEANSGREYIHHQSIPAENDGQFNFQWRSPSDFKGDITFYVASMAANGNGQKTGDQLYLASSVISGWVTGLKDQVINPLAFQSYPNPVSDNLNIQYDLKHPGNISIKLFNLEGQIVQELYEGYQALGQQQQSFSLNRNELASGLYLLKIRTTSKEEVQKIIFE